MNQPDSSFFANILSPGSSFHPTFLLILDGAFSMLFVVLLALAFFTKGNMHIFALMGIEMMLWASVKWFVYELRSIQSGALIEGEEKREESKKES